MYKKVMEKKAMSWEDKKKIAGSEKTGKRSPAEN